MTDRQHELGVALAAVRARIGRACAAAGRAPADVELLPVTKGAAAADVVRLGDLGLWTFGENRVQEARSKIAEVAELRPGLPLRWHLIGRMQRKKARGVATWAARVESVDSPELARAIADAVRRARDAGERTGPLSVLLQLSLDGDPNRGGVPAGDLLSLAELVASDPGLRLDGLMAVAPQAVDPDQAFATLAAQAAQLRTEHPAARVLSAGMTGDLDAAIRHGSTCVRVGTALLGPRRLTSADAAGDQGG